MKALFFLLLVTVVWSAKSLTAYDFFDSLCVGLRDGEFLQHPFDCHKFIRCSHSRALEFQCPGKLLWHHKIKTCDFSYRTKCNENNALYQDKENLVAAINYEAVTQKFFKEKTNSSTKNSTTFQTDLVNTSTNKSVNISNVKNEKTAKNRQRNKNCLYNNKTTTTIFQNLTKDHLNLTELAVNLTNKHKQNHTIMEKNVTDLPLIFTESKNIENNINRTVFVNLTNNTNDTEKLTNVSADFLELLNLTESYFKYNTTTLPNEERNNAITETSELSKNVNNIANVTNSILKELLNSTESYFTHNTTTLSNEERNNTTKETTELSENVKNIANVTNSMLTQLMNSTESYFTHNTTILTNEEKNNTIAVTTELTENVDNIANVTNSILKELLNSTESYFTHNTTILTNEERNNITTETTELSENVYNNANVTNSMLTELLTELSSDTTNGKETNETEFNSIEIHDYATNTTALMTDSVNITAHVNTTETLINFFNSTESFAQSVIQNSKNINDSKTEFSFTLDYKNTNDSNQTNSLSNLNKFFVNTTKFFIDLTADKVAENLTKIEITKPEYSTTLSHKMDSNQGILFVNTTELLVNSTEIGELNATESLKSEITKEFSALNATESVIKSETTTDNVEVAKTSDLLATSLPATTSTTLDYFSNVNNFPIDTTTQDPRLPFRPLICQGENNRLQFKALKCFQYYQCFAGWAFLLNCQQGWFFQAKNGECILDVKNEC